MKTKIKNSKGEYIEIVGRAERLCEVNQRFVNALGYDIDITTLTAITSKVTEQKFFEVRPSLYIPVVVGNGAFSQQLLTYRSYSLGAGFEEGFIDTGADDSRLASTDTGVDAVPVKIKNWAKKHGWTLFDIEQAAKAGNWSLVEAKEKARKKDWDLGVQKLAFLGANGDSAIKGLLNMAGVNINTTFITAPISGLSTANLKLFCEGILNVYRANNNRTAMPSHFVMPESDYLGLAGPASADFPIRSTMSLLLETFKVMTGNENFQILPLAYADAAYNATAGINKQCYALYNYDEESFRMDIPVDYTNTMANSVDSFSFSNVGYGQVTGVNAYRPLEILYFQY